MVRLVERRTACATWRVRLVTLCCVLAFSVMAGGTVWRSSVQGAMLVDEAESRYQQDIPLNEERGPIWDRHGRLLAADAVVYSAYANPNLLRRWGAQRAPDEVDAVTAALADGFGLAAGQVRDVLGRDTGFAYLAHDLSPERARRLQALDLPHVGFEKRFRRFYPAAQEAAHVVGFVDHEGVGQAGIEQLAQHVLAPKAGERRVLRTAGGDELEEFHHSPAVSGEDLTLTVDSRLQYLAAQTLWDTAKRHAARAASFVLLDIHTGDILAMVSWPGYNPNVSGAPAEHRRNRVVQDSFEPGSTVKPLLAAIAIDEGVVEPGTILPTAKPIFYRGKTITDKRVDTDISVAETIMRSSNKGAVRVAELLDDEAMWSGFERFGFGHDALAWPGGNRGMLHHHSNWRPVEKATMAYGYFLSGSLMHLVRAYAALGNGGMLPATDIILGRARPAPRRVVSAQAAAQVLTMMEDVVSTAGTAPQAAINGYRVAGKTGTSHKANTDARGYDTSSYSSLFVGVAPVSAPRFAAAVLVDEPTAGGYYGGTVAAPAFAAVMEAALLLYGVPPDRLPEVDGSGGGSNVPDQGITLARTRR